MPGMKSNDLTRDESLAVVYMDCLARCRAQSAHLALVFQHSSFKNGIESVWRTFPACHVFHLDLPYASAESAIERDWCAVGTDLWGSVLKATSELHGTTRSNETRSTAESK